MAKSGSAAAKQEFFNSIGQEALFGHQNRTAALVGSGRLGWCVFLDIRATRSNGRDSQEHAPERTTASARLRTQMGSIQET
jgi:hypothetical protein